MSRRGEKDTGSRGDPGRLICAVVDQRTGAQSDPKTSQPDDALPKSADPKTSQPDDALPKSVQAPPESVQAPPIDRARARRLRADAQRPLSENLAEGIALSHLLVRYARDTPHR
jgi:hypothetical protein